MKNFGGIALLILVVGVGLYFVSTEPREKITPPTIPPAGEISIEGVIVCLPHRNTSGPQTLECAFGLQDEVGVYYSLRDTNPAYQNISSAPMGVPVVVTGTFTPREDEKYQSSGIIDIQSIEARED